MPDLCDSHKIIGSKMIGNSRSEMYHDKSGNEFMPLLSVCYKPVCLIIIILNN